MSCVPGVTGSDLKKRIVGIMAGTAIRKLDLKKKALLTMAATFLVTAPVTRGVMHAAAQQSETAAKETGIQGTWQGTFQVPNGRQLRAVVKISGTAPDDLKVVLYSIDQGGQPVPATSASFEKVPSSLPFGPSR
jgi:hypothetical protein